MLPRALATAQNKRQKNLQVNFFDLGFLVRRDKSKDECWETDKQKLKGKYILIRKLSVKTNLEWPESRMVHWRELVETHVLTTGLSSITSEGALGKEILNLKNLSKSLPVHRHKCPIQSRRRPWRGRRNWPPTWKRKCVVKLNCFFSVYNSTHQQCETGVE